MEMDAAFALGFSRRGADIVMHYGHSERPALAVLQQIESLGRRAFAIKADISKPEDMATLFQQAIAHFGQLNVVMSSSGIEHFGDVLSVTPEEFDRVYVVNTRGQFFVAQQAYRHVSPGGRVILTTSISTHSSSWHSEPWRICI